VIPARSWTCDAYGGRGREGLATIAEEAELLRVLLAASGFAAGLQREVAPFVSLRYRRRAGVRRTGDGGAIAAAACSSRPTAPDLRFAAAQAFRRTNAPYAQTAVVANFLTERAHDATALQWFLRMKAWSRCCPLPITVAKRRSRWSGRRRTSLRRNYSPLMQSRWREG